MLFLPNLQNFLTVVIEIVLALFFGMMTLDFVTGLVKLWHCCDSKLLYCQQQLTPQQLTASQSPDTPPAIFNQARLVTKQLEKRTKPSSNLVKEAAVDSETLTLIEKGTQVTIRSVGKQLGIAVRVNGRYQRLDYLRAQIKYILKSQPNEVRQAFQQTEQKAA
ncbi:hypothetical protein H6S82_08045 [Planktothrix sp. FACHB-1355]|uniref:Uncharacterized protein n=1 Tax=Aerosakkonema funiforme FACHB-1375 TaxID=2949571 RepID=A0A926ZGF0_9CYAN|nr:MULTISPECIES: hypothetical protein [Oscillatoriales]MBD2181057.1 hypothetical protein [Aerosakkonema funiforme FACHB-1375]MBD3558806.1 hypothetical protein [Planktothrix sp. FACHB-1355]